MNTTFHTFAAIAAVAATLAAQDPSMIRGIGWRTETIFTVGQTFNGYTPPGILDGTAAFPTGVPGRALILVNHELGATTGYPYQLANGVTITGARVSALEISRTGDGRGIVHSAGLAYDRAHDRQGNLVVDPAQINETGRGIEGYARFCSSQGVRAGTFDFVDDLYFNGEETGTPGHPHGGTCQVIDVRGRAIWALPLLGRGTWENLTPVDTGDASTIGLLLGDDSTGAPLYLFVGRKNAIGDGSLLDRNGLKQGQLHVWVADNGDTTPQQFNTAGSVRSGRFMPIEVRDPAQAGVAGYDAEGYLNDRTLRARAQSMGAFQFSRPEDLDTNPADGTQVAFASTGRGSVYPADNWGTTYIVDLDFGAAGITASIEILHDADNIAVPDMGVRSPDNLVWARDGYIYVNEDRSTSPGSLFGAVSGKDASIWQIDPANGDIRRIGEINRTVVLPVGSTDAGAGILGVPETSGVIDVTDLFQTVPGETLLLTVVQAHGIQDGLIGGNAFLDEGGQMLFMSNVGIDHALRCTETATGVDLTFDVTNGDAGNGYGVILALQNAGNAPNGWFFGVDVTFAELGLLSAPLIGMLDSDGAANFTFSIPGAACPLGLTIDSVAIELGFTGAPVRRGPAVTLRF